MFLGGATFFFGPIIGAVLMVFALVMLSELTKAWLLYLGLVFLLMVMYAPGGVASLIMMNRRVHAFIKLGRLVPGYIGLLVGGLVILAGVAAMVEMLYHLQLNQALGPQMSFLGIALDASSVSAWAGAAIVAVVGAVLFEWVRRRFRRSWISVQVEIEAEILKREAAAS